MNDPVSKRYAKAIPQQVELNDTLRVILGHKTCRAYDPRPVPDTVLDVLIASAQSAPSSCNLQCWSVIAVSDPERRQTLAALCGQQRHVTEAPVYLCFVADLSRIAQVSQRNGLAIDTLDYLEMSVVGIIDAALAAQNLATAAASLGLGTSYIGGLRNSIDKVSEVLGLPDRMAPVFGMTLGYPDPARQSDVKPRLSSEAVLHREIYTAPDVDRIVDEYEAAMDAFNKGQGRAVPLWGLTSAKRIATTDRMEGRDVLLPLLQARGMALK